MRYKLALILAVSIGAAASVYTPTAEARVYVAVRPPVPVFVRPAVPAIAGAGIYYGAAPYFGAGYYLDGYRRYGYGYHGFPHLGYGYRRWGHHRR
jgi:hypothetical protein